MTVKLCLCGKPALPTKRRGEGRCADCAALEAKLYRSIHKFALLSGVRRANFAAKRAAEELDDAPFVAPTTVRLGNAGVEIEGNVTYLL